MKTLLLFFILIAGNNCMAQFSKGFDKREVKDMIAICNSYTFLELYKSDADIIPSAYKKIYTSPVLGMDNKFQLYQYGNVAVINLRGSTDKQLSWVENTYSAMIAAKGMIKINGDTFNYCFAQNKAATVHSGYALAIGYLHKDLLKQIKGLNTKGIYHFIITGHSQGGALANMLRAYLENTSGLEIANENNFKTYAFAAPMTGNKNFATEYNASYCNDKSSFNIVNPADMVPTLPLSYNDTSYLADNVKDLLLKKDSFNFKKMATDGGALLLEKKLSKLVNWMGWSASQKINTDIGPVVMPAYVTGINYHPVGNRIELAGFEYPKILKDSAVTDKNLSDKELYKKGSWTFQHKPYNYYSAVVKLYFPKEYKRLKKKYLIENL